MNILSIKNSQGLYSAAQSVLAHLPARLVYPGIYFKITSLLKKYYSGDEEAVLACCRANLAEILRMCLTHVPHYMDLNLKINPKNITAETALDVLKEFPYLQKDVVMSAPVRFLPDFLDPKKQHFGTSGGSTGQGIKIYRSFSLMAAEQAFFHFVWNRVTGFTRGCRQMRFTCSGIKQESQDPFSVSGPILYVSPYHVNEKWCDVIYQRALEYKPAIIHGYPSCVAGFVNYLKQTGKKLPSLKGMTLGSEAVPPVLLDSIQDVWPGLPVVFHYGLCENTNLAWGKYENGRIFYKCEQVYGFSENYVHPDGIHEIVGTNYWYNLMPLVRYRTQDLGVIRDGIIESLDGRVQEFLISRDGKKIPGFSMCIDKFVWDYVEILQKVQNEPGKVEFHIQPRSNYEPSIADRILASQQEKWGGFFDMKVIVCDKIERTVSGKLRSTINNIGKKTL